MAKCREKGRSGAAKNYITRTQAVRKLQISLPDFRRLCIFKGIYPREPRNKKKANKSASHSTTFYYTRDIQFLLHEPLLAKFREHKALAKKISRAIGRGEVGDAARLERNLTPRTTLDHIIKKRYPTFVDALRDLDDCLSMLFLFANLPSTTAVSAKTIALCKRRTLEFEHYLIVSHSLRKSFLSIKGIYYQATIHGQDILWLVPYKFVQRIPIDVDFRIMGTFVEFYTALLGFVNFRLYTSVGLIYPPKFNKESDDQSGGLGAFTLQGNMVDNQSALEPSPATSVDVKVSKAAQAAADKAATLIEPTTGHTPVEEGNGDLPSNAIDKFEATCVGADELPQPQASSSEAAALFDKYTIYISRETPREPLEFILKAFGCKRVGWDPVLGDGAYTTNEADPAITHQIVDRPGVAVARLPEFEPKSSEGKTTQWSRPDARVPGRTYIQPQWVWDSINHGRLLRPDLYAPGASLPAHLSPWAKPAKGEYDPTKSLEDQEREGEAEEAEEDDAEAEQGVFEEKTKGNKLIGLSDHVEAGEGMEVAGFEDDDDDDKTVWEQNEEAEDEEGGKPSQEVDSDVSDSEAARIQHQRELEAEARGKPYAANDADKKRKDDVRKRKVKKDRAEAEELERQKIMMSRKKRKLLEKMTYSNKKKDETAERLRSKRRKLEKSRMV